MLLAGLPFGGVQLLSHPPVYADVKCTAVASHRLLLKDLVTTSKREKMNKFVWIPLLFVLMAHGVALPYRCAEELVERFVQSNSIVGLGTGVLVSYCNICLAFAHCFCVSTTAMVAGLVIAVTFVSVASLLHHQCIILALSLGYASRP